MARALVVYESMFGNTRTVAEAIADGLATRVEVRVAEVGGVSPVIPHGVDLIVVGGPTHAFGMSRAQTRATARQQATEPLVSNCGGIREWIEGIDAPIGTAAATFGTRVPSPLLFGSAARSAARQLRRSGFILVTRPEDFHVNGTPGPLRDGEVERARAWGEHVADALLAELAAA